MGKGSRKNEQKAIALMHYRWVPFLDFLEEKVEENGLNGEGMAFLDAEARLCEHLMLVYPIFRRGRGTARGFSFDFYGRA